MDRTSKLNFTPLISFDEQFKSGLFGEKGWGREPVTKALNVPGETIGAIFPHADPDLSLTVRLNDKVIGTISCNKYDVYLAQLPKNIVSVATMGSPEPGVMEFVRLHTDVCLEEKNVLLPHLESEGHTLDHIAHRCGAVMLEEEGGKKYATEAVGKSDALLKEKGFTAVVVTATHIGSRRIFEKNGYTVHKEFPVAGRTDPCTLLYKRL